MQLVELETDTGQKVWINPQHVVRLTADRNTKDITFIYLLGSAQEYLSVRGAATAVADKLNAGLKGDAVEPPKPSRLSPGLTRPG